MTKKDVECQVHTWMIKKGKKAMVYKARKDRRKGDRNRKKKRRKGRTKKEIRFLGHVRRNLLLNSTLIFLTFLH